MNFEPLIFFAPTAALLAAMVLSLTRALMGPSVFDRMLAVNSFGTKTVMMIALYGFITGRPDFLDLALVYAIMNFIGVIAVLKFFLVRDMSRADHAEEVEG